MLKIALNPTFWADVEVSVPGEKKKTKVKMQFIHRPKEQYLAFVGNLEDKTDVEIFMELVKDWEGIDAPFSKANVEILLENYHGLCLNVFNVYNEEYAKARTKKLEDVARFFFQEKRLNAILKNWQH